MTPNVKRSKWNFKKLLRVILKIAPALKFKSVLYFSFSFPISSWLLIIGLLERFILNFG